MNLHKTWLDRAGEITLLRWLFGATFYSSPPPLCTFGMLITRSDSRTESILTWNLRIGVQDAIDSINPSTSKRDSPAHLWAGNLAWASKTTASYWVHTSSTWRLNTSTGNYITEIQGHYLWFLPYPRTTCWNISSFTAYNEDYRRDILFWFKEGYFQSEHNLKDLTLHQIIDLQIIPCESLLNTWWHRRLRESTNDRSWRSVKWRRYRAHSKGVSCVSVSDHRIAGSPTQDIQEEFYRRSVWRRRYGWWAGASIETIITRV